MKTRKLLSVIITLAMVASLPTMAASAEGEKAHVPFLFYNEATKTEERSVCTAYEFMDSFTSEWENGKWYVADGELRISGHVTVSGNVFLILKDGCKLTAPLGIHLTAGNSLTIFAQSKGEQQGMLTVTGDEAAGIGGYDKEGCGTLKIYGGNINAIGDDNAAGIGGGSGGSGGTVEIYGGKTEAHGICHGAGIGGGISGQGGTVKIYGGTVTAIGGEGKSGVASGDGAGIGGGGGAAGGITEIYGGCVTASSENGGAGIGGGGNSDYNGSVTVGDGVCLFNMADGTLFTKGDDREWCDLLCGSPVSFCSINPSEEILYSAYNDTDRSFTEKKCADYERINESMQMLTSGWYVVEGTPVFEGTLVIIGDVHLILTDLCELQVNGGIKLREGDALTVYAQSNNGESGILTAKGLFNCAGIGGGINEQGGTITICGGHVTATGGHLAAGIGGGLGGSGGTVKIYGGSVTATSGGNVTVASGGGASIGRGGNGEGDGTLAVSEKMTIINSETKETIGINDVPGCVSVSVFDPTPEPEPENTKYRKYESGTFVTKTCEEETFYPVNPWMGAVWEDEWYEVSGELTLDDVTVTGNANLILKDGCTLTVTEGIHVPAGSSLTVYAQSEGENMGALIATGAGGAAGIGGEGKVTIHGGRITATGGDGYYLNEGGAGIGSNGDDSEKGCDVTIYGGTIEATGGDGGAGIGSGYFELTYDYNGFGDCVPDKIGTAGKIAIYGGNITAQGGYSSAGIGGGYGCDGGDIAIYGGLITATGGENSGWGAENQASGIGCGWFDEIDKGDGRIIQSYPVTGGTVTIGNNMEVYDKDGKLVSFDGKMPYVKITEKESVSDTLSLTITGNAFAVTPSGADAGEGIVTVALYDSADMTRLLDVKVFDLAKVGTPTGAFTKSGYVRAYWWSDFGKMQRLCAPADGIIAE